MTNVAMPWKAITSNVSFYSSPTRGCSNNAPTLMVKPFIFIYIHSFKIDDLKGFAHQEIVIEEGLNIGVRWIFLHHWRFWSPWITWRNGIPRVDWSFKLAVLVTNCNSAGFWESMKGDLQEWTSSNFMNFQGISDLTNTWADALQTRV